MRNITRQTCGRLFVAAWLTVAVTAYADVPRIISYQGRLLGQGNDLVELEVTFYDSAAGSTVLFSETHTGVPLHNGIFSIGIGSQTPDGVPDSALDAPAVWLGLRVGAGQELSPRTRIGMVPFAGKAASAEQLVRPGTMESAVRVSDTGDVGIGTSDPSYPLHVEGDGFAVIHGLNTKTSGGAYGGQFDTMSTYGIAVYGSALNAEGPNIGVYGRSFSTAGTGVDGWAGNSTGNTKGVAGRSASSEGIGVFGHASAETGTNYGVMGSTRSSDGYAGYFTGGRNYFEGHVGIGVTPAPGSKLRVATDTAVGITASTTFPILGTAIWGEAAAETGDARGVWGTSRGPDGVGVLGEATADTGDTRGVSGGTFSPDGVGVWGEHAADTGIAPGVYGVTHSTDDSYGDRAAGVKGEATSATGDAVGVVGVSAAESGSGVRGVATDETGTDTYGGYFTNAGTDGGGVYGYGNRAGGHFVTASPIGTGVVGVSYNSSGTNYGGWFSNRSPDGIGVYAESEAPLEPAIEGVNTGSAELGGGIGVRGEGGFSGVEGSVSPDPLGEYSYWGVFGAVTGGAGENLGVYGVAHSGQTNYGVYGEAHSGETNYAGYFDGNTHTTGLLSKGGGLFKIDHPLDPENKYLCHSFVESPDMMNVYNDNVVLDDAGQATVVLPDWFEALNRDFRYQLTCIGGFAPVYIAEEISGNMFTIAGGTPGMKVSWQVTGVRRDAFAQANRIQVEVEKPDQERRTYLHPEAHGKPGDLQVDRVRKARSGRMRDPGARDARERAREAKVGAR